MSDKRSIVSANRPEVNLRTGGAGSLPSVVARPLATATPGLSIASTTAETDALLRSLDMGVGRFNETAKAFIAEDREKQFKEGQLAQETNQKDFAKAVEDGTIPQAANPWFIKGYQNQDGRVAGNNYYTEMRAAYSQSEAKGSDDPKVYEKFVQEFTKSYMARVGTDKSAEWSQGFQTVSNGARQTLASEHAQQAEAAVLAKSEANTGAEVNAILNGTKDPQAAASAINVLGDKMRLEGMPKATFEKVVAEAILAKAKLGDAGMLKALDYVKTGDNATLSSNPKVVSARVDTENWLTEKRRGDQRWAWANDDRQWSLQTREWAKTTHAREEDRWKQQQAEFGRHEKARSMMTIIQTSTMADPAGAYVNNRDALTELAKVDPTAAASTVAFLDAFTTRRERVDDATERPVIAQLQRDMILSSGNPQAQQQLLLQANTLFTQNKMNRETMMKFIDDAQRFASWDPQTQRKLQSDGIKRVEAAVEKALASDPIKGATGGVALDVLYVNQAMQRKLMDVLKANPTATEEMLVDEATKSVTNSMKSLGMSPQFSGKAEALGTKVPGAVQRTAPQDGAAAPKALPTVESAITSISPTDQGEFVRQVQSAMETGGMPAMLKAIADFDQKIGIPGLGRSIIERNSQPPAAPTKKK